MINIFCPELNIATLLHQLTKPPLIASWNPRPLYSWQRREL